MSLSMKSFQKKRIHLAKAGRDSCPSVAVDVWASADLSQWVEFTEDFYKGELKHIQEVKCSKEACVHLVNDLPATGAYFIKRFFMRDTLDYAKHLFRRARALREFRGGQLAASVGIAVPEVCCVLVKRCFGMVTESAIITKAVLDATRFPEYYMQLSASSSGRAKAKIENLMVSLANEVAKWHNLGVCHGEMHLGNVLCRPKQDSFDFIWVDNERTCRYRGSYDQIRNLAELNKTRAIMRGHRLVFWQRYCNAVNMDQPIRSAMLKKVIAKSKHGVCNSK